MSKYSVPMVVISLLLLIGSTNAQEPKNEVNSNSVKGTMMPPFGNYILPVGTYTVAKGVTKVRITAKLGEIKKVNGVDQFVLDAVNDNPRTATLGQGQNNTLTWTTAMFSNVPGGVTKILWIEMFVQYGNPPGAEQAIDPTRVNDFTFPN